MPRADPYRDPAVIDERATRASQALVALLTLGAFAAGLWPLLALAALHLAATLFLGRRANVAFRLWFDVLQPRLGEGPLEDARPPRFANQVGLALLAAATAAHLAGFPRLGWALGLAVGGLALLSAATGLCVGCRMYRIAAYARGVRGRRIDGVDLAELGVPAGAEAVVGFTHPLCSECRGLERRLAARGLSPVLVDVSRRPDLARKYGVSLVPVAYRVRADGSVARRVRG